MLGSYLLLELLRNGKKVRASRRINTSLKTTQLIFKSLQLESESLFSQIEWVNVNLFNQDNIEEHLSDISEIYHCAAQINSSQKEGTQLIENNRLITANIVNAALNQNVSKFCHVSSISALGNAIKDELISEKTIWKEHKNNTSYSISKYLSEMEVWRGIAEGLNAVIVNPSVILGIGDWNKGSANLFKKMDEGMKYYTYGSSGFVAAKDVVELMLILMNCKSCFKQNYIVSAENINFKTIFESIAKSLEIQFPKIYATPFLTQLAWRLEWIKSKFSGIKPLITKESAQTAHKILKYDNTKLLKQVSYNYTLIEDSILDISKAYRKFEN